MSKWIRKKQKHFLALFYMKYCKTLNIWIWLINKVFRKDIEIRFHKVFIEGNWNLHPRKNSLKKKKSSEFLCLLQHPRPELSLLLHMATAKLFYVEASTLALSWSTQCAHRGSSGFTGRSLGKLLETCWLLGAYSISRRNKEKSSSMLEHAANDSKLRVCDFWILL